MSVTLAILRILRKRVERQLGERHYLREPVQLLRAV